MPNDAPAPPSPVDLAARLNQYTPRGVGLVSAAGGSAPPVPAPAAGPAAAAPEPAPDAARLPLRERVERGEGSAELLVFRVGAELFALALDAVEEVVEVERVHGVPEAPGATLGVVELRGRMVPLVSPARALGVVPAALGAMLVLRNDDRRVGIAIDDVDDVLTVGLAALCPAPAADAGDGVLLAMARRDRELVGLLDAESLLAACLVEARTLETAA